MKPRPYHFVEFTYARGGAYIRIGKARQFIFSADFCLQHRITSQTRMMLHYDSHKKAIGFEFVEADMPHSYAMTPYGMKRQGRLVTAVSFFKSHHIDAKKVTGRYKYEVLEVNKTRLYVMQLPSESKP